MTKKNKDKTLLVLDLDETLIHSEYNNPDYEYDFMIFDYKVKKRPFLDEFIQECSKHFLLAVWSSGSDDYVEAIVKEIIPESIQLEFVWGRSKATYQPSNNIYDWAAPNLSHFDYLKRLNKIKKLGFSMEKALIVDDSPHKSKANYGNAIYVEEFLGDMDDKELFYLQKYLMELKDVKNVRSIEKRGWKNKFINQL